MKDIDHPILGDKKYGNKKSPANRLMLHAKELVIINPKTKKKMTFLSEAPKSFNLLFDERKI